MKKAGLFFLLTILGLGGCKTTQPHDGNMRVLILNGKSLPSEVAGVWVADRANWLIEIQKDGTIPRVVHTIGAIEVFNGQSRTFPLVEDGQGFVQPGPWILQYDHRTQELMVEINLAYFEWDKKTEKVYGKSRDVLTGPVQSDGTWRATWIAFPEYFVTTEQVVDYQLPIEEGTEDQGQILFTRKTDPKKD